MPGGNSKWYRTLLVKEIPSAVSTRPLKRGLPERLALTMVPVPTQKKRKGITTRRSNSANVVDLTRSDKSGLFQSMNKHSEKDAEPKLVVNMILADIKPNPTARAIANQTWWELPKAYVLFCDVKRRAGDNGDLLFP
jgi:hypothetical protein